MKKFFLLLFALILIPLPSSAASFDKIMLMQDQEARDFLVSLAGKPAWYDANSTDDHTSIEALVLFHPKPNIDDGLKTLSNIEHVIIGNVDIESGIIEIIKDNGDKFLWQPNHDIDSDKHVNSTAAQTVALDIRGMFYFNNPYEMHPDWSENAWSSIKSKKVYIGMNCEMVLMSWGKPSQKHKSSYDWGTEEQWVYNSDDYLYFENGILKATQD